MFAIIPDTHAPPSTHPWGRTPVHASVDGQSWETSVWRDKKHGTLLPVPKRLLTPKARAKARGAAPAKGDGDFVMVELRSRDA